MIPQAEISTRRERLQAELPDPVLLVGNHAPHGNSSSVRLRFRQESTFLYYTGCRLPGAAALFLDGQYTLFLPAPAPNAALWHGQFESFDELCELHGAHRLLAMEKLPEILERLQVEARPIHALAIEDARAMARLREWTGLALDPVAEHEEERDSQALREVAARHRSVKSPTEVAEIRRAVEVTAEGHRRLFAACRPGVKEQELARELWAAFLEADFAEAYEAIVTVRGDVLHCESYENTLEVGQLLLVDAAAAAPSGYASDVTRTFPVSGKLTPFQRDLYGIALAAETAGIDACGAGSTYADVHRAAASILAEGLREVGLLRGSVGDLVESGAVALFYPHGTSHPLGLDTHDMDSLMRGAEYLKNRKDERMGLKYLRNETRLEPGHVLTVEPGIYFAASILENREFRETFRDQVDFARVDRHMGFGGIRIEDDILVTAGDPENLSVAIPKSPEAMERGRNAMRSS